MRESSIAHRQRAGMRKAVSLDVNADEIGTNFAGSNSDSTLRPFVCFPFFSRS